MSLPLAQPASVEGGHSDQVFPAALSVALVRLHRPTPPFGARVEFNVLLPGSSAVPRLSCTDAPTARTPLPPLPVSSELRTTTREFNCTTRPWPPLPVTSAK